MLYMLQVYNKVIHNFYVSCLIFFEFQHVLQVPQFAIFFNLCRYSDHV